MLIRLRRIKFKTIYSANKIFAFAIVGILWGLSITYCDMTDYAVYYREYNSILETGIIGLTHTFEVGFSLILFLCAKFKISFELFYGVYMSIVLFLLARFLKKYLGIYSYAIFLFGIFPFINYLQQIRSCLGAVIVMNALDLLFSEARDRKKHILKYILMVLITATIQISNIVYLIFLLAIFFDKSILKKWIPIIFIVVPSVISFLYIRIYDFILNSSIFSRVSHNMMRNATLSRFSVFNIVIYGILLVLMLYLERVCRIKDGSQLDFLYKVSLIEIALSLFNCLSANAYRISAMTLPIVFVTIILLARNSNRALNRVVAYLGIGVFVFMLVFTYWGPVNPSMNYILTHIMWKVHP